MTRGATCAAHPAETLAPPGWPLAAGSAPASWRRHPSESVLVSALLVAYNTRDLLLAAIRSLGEQTRPPVQVVVVDNASSDGSADAVAATFPEVALVRSTTNDGFAAGVNRAARLARGDALLLLNPDAALQPDGLERLCQVLAAHPRAAAVGAALRYADGRHQDSAFRFPGLAQLALDLFPVPRLAGSRLNGRYPPGQTHPFQVDHPLGACMLIRRSAWEDVGAFDEGYFMYVEEVDWCRRARARGWQVWHEPRAVAVHHAGQATRQRAEAMFVELWRSRLRYYARHHGAGYNRLVRALVRLGLRAEAARACRRLSGPALERRRAAIEAVRRLAS